MRLFSAYIILSLISTVIPQLTAAILPSDYSLRSKDLYKGANSDFGAQTANDSVYEQYLSLVSNLVLTGGWNNLTNATQEGDFFSKNEGFVTFQASVTNTTSGNSDGDMVLQIFDGYTIASNYLTISFYFQDLDFGQESSYFFGNIIISQDFRYQDSMSPYDNNTNCLVFLELIFTDDEGHQLTSPQDLSNGVGIQLFISNSSCSMPLWTNVLTNQPLPTGYQEKYIIIMSVLLLCGALFGLGALRGFLTRPSQIKTMGLWGLLLLFAWYLAMFPLNINMLLVFDNFWLLIPTLLALLDCIIIALILSRYRILIEIERWWEIRRRRSRNITFWVQYLVALVLAWVFAICVNLKYFCYVYLITPLFLVPQIINKFRKPNRARAHWPANFIFFTSQTFFIVYFFAYENNLLGIQTNFPLVIAFFSIYLFELLVLALLKLREDPQIIANQNNLFRPLIVPDQESRQSISEDPNQPRNPYESPCCPICINDFKSPPVDPRNVEIDANDTDAAIILKCGHSCHRVCLLKWFEKSKTCPSCRKKVGKEKI